MHPDLAKLPEDFTYLKKVDPTIIQEIRYSTNHNFIGRPINGYLANECILTVPAAKALSMVQKEFQKLGYSLKIYDCYRPTKAVEDFYIWSQNKSQQEMKEEFYSELEKDKLFDLGYIAKKSGHSRGSTVDLTLVSLPPKEQPNYKSGDPLKPCYETYGKRFPDNSINMGTGFDCFHSLSHTNDPRIVGEAKENRQLLKGMMEKYGFQNYYKEWWHYSFINEPFPDTYFNFDILPF